MSIRVGVISDSHGVLREDMMEVLQTCDYILHAGDFADESILEELQFLARLYVVRGNSDRWWADYLADVQRFCIGDLRFALIHDRSKLGEAVDDADVIVYGHTHHYAAEIVAGQLWLNPGSCGISRFGEELSFVIMEIDGRDYKIERILL